MGNVFEKIADTDTSSYLSEIIGIDLDPADLENFYVISEGSGHHRRCTIPLIADAKRLLRANKKYFTASGNIAKSHKMAANRGPGATMPINRGVLATKTQTTKTSKYPYVIAPSNNTLHSHNVLNAIKHPNVLHGDFLGQNLANATKKLRKSVTKNLESGTTRNPSAIVSHNPGTTRIPRNTNKTPRTTLVRNSSVIPTTGAWLTAAKRSSRTATRSSLVTVMKKPRSNITGRPSATTTNPWAMLNRKPLVTPFRMSRRTTSQNPLMATIRDPWVTPIKPTLTITSRNPNIDVIRKSSATTMRNQNRVGNRNPNNMITKIPYNATVQNSNKATTQKSNSSVGRNSNGMSIQKPNRIVTRYPNQIARRNPNTIARQHSNRLAAEDVNHITIEEANKVVIQRPSATTRDKDISQNPNLITIRNANIVNIS
ncbi:ETS domain-containing protein Elk-4 isoform X1 [Mustelus asterias]